MARFSTCSACHRQAIYYCKNCKRVLCNTHVKEVNVVYYCYNCDKETYSERCNTCGNKTSILRVEDLYLCDWCNVPVVDALSYVRELPNTIYSKYKELNKKMAEIWLITKKYQTVVESLYKIRKGKIMLFSEIEDDLYLLKNQIETFIEHLYKFEDRSFEIIDKKLHAIQYLRYEDISTIPQAEEVIELIDSRLEVLDETIKEKVQNLEIKLNSIQGKIRYVEYHYNKLLKINSFLPEIEEEELIAILPRVWIKKERRLPKKCTLVITNKNIYLYREKGLFKVRIKIEENISIFNIRETSSSNNILFGNIFTLKTNVNTYTIFGNSKAIEQLPDYFFLVKQYINFAISSTDMIENLRNSSPTISKLNGSINTHLRLLNATLLKKTEVLSDIRERKIIDHETKDIINKLQSIQRKIAYLRGKKGMYPSQVGNDGVITKLLREQRRLQNRLEELRQKANKFDEFFDIENQY